MIRRRDPGHFGMPCILAFFSPLKSLVDALAGPILLSIALFVAVLANFIIRGAHVLYFFNCLRLSSPTCAVREM